MEQPYHKYVFDTASRVFVGKFEEMYRQEDVEGFDSWRQEDMTSLNVQLSMAVLKRYKFSRILDVGCGKGAFTNVLKEPNNYVLGIDISSTAISKAKSRFPHIDFRCMGVDQLPSLSRERFDLVAAMEILSYLEDWRDVIRIISGMTEYFFLTLYIPENPIGFVKSFPDLTEEIAKHFTSVTELIVDKSHVIVLAKAKT